MIIKGNGQYSFRFDPRLKELVMERVKKDGITLKSLLVYCMQGYLEGDIVFHVETNRFYREHAHRDYYKYFDPKYNNTNKPKPIPRVLKEKLYRIPPEEIDKLDLSISELSDYYMYRYEYEMQEIE